MSGGCLWETQARAWFKGARAKSWGFNWLFSLLLVPCRLGQTWVGSPPQTENTAPCTLPLLLGGFKVILKHSVAWTRNNKAHSFPTQPRHTASAKACNLSAPASTCQLLSVFSTYRSPGRTQGGWFSPGWKGGSTAGLDQQLPPGQQFPGGRAAMGPASLCGLSSPSLSRDQVFARALPQLSVSLDLRLLFWPLTSLSARTSSVIRFFCPSHHSVLAASTGRQHHTNRMRGKEGENFIWSIEWLKRKKVAFIFFLKARNLFNLHWSTIWPNRLIGSNGQPDRIRQIDESRRAQGLPSFLRLLTWEQEKLLPKKPLFQTLLSMGSLYFAKESPCLKKHKFSCHTHLWQFQNILKASFRKQKQMLPHGIQASGGTPGLQR